MILFCGPPSATLDYLREQDEVRVTEDPIETIEADFIVSHGYRHIVSPDVLAQVPAVNLHVAYLPWNRGAHPNFWSVYESTPAGVTVHYMDEGIDTGPIIAQRRVEHAPSDTFASSYEVLQYAMTELFKEVWPAIRAGKANARPQPPIGGTGHRCRDLVRVEHLLTEGWDTPVAAVEASGLESAKRMAA